MSNLVTMPAAPSYLAALIAANPELAAINAAAMSGITAGYPPVIFAYGKGNFSIKKDGQVTPITLTVQANGQDMVVPASQLSAIILKAKTGFDKRYHASKFDPHASEAKAPDCWSKDGVRPDPSSTLKQCESCAGCPQNAFGSGTDASGNAAKGKACSDRKTLAIYTNREVFQFEVTPASLKNFGAYLKQLDAYGLYLPTVITQIGFDAASSYTVFTFSCGGALTEQQMGTILPILNSPEVAEIIGGKTLAPPVAPIQLQAPPAPAPQPVSNPFGDVSDLVAPVVEAAPKKAAPRRTAAAPAEPVVTAPLMTSAPSDDDLRAQLGL